MQLNCLDYSTTNRSSCAHDGSTKFGLSYSYPASPSNNGIISSISDSVDSGRNATYSYDSLNRLLTAQTPGSTNYPAWGLQQYYDSYGNRYRQQAISGCSAITCPQPSVTISTSTNRLVGSPYAYDLSGNMTDDGINTLVYDAENHAVSATNGSAAGAYVYDGKGLRVQRCLPSCGGSNPNTVYIFSGSKVIAEYDNGAAVGSPSREYIYSGAALLAKIDSSSTKYYHQDHLSNRLITDSSGNTLIQQGHFPYGENWYGKDGSGNNITPDKWQFTTYERDAESINDYAQARYNVSGLARFSTPDPISGSTSDPQSLNRYSYVRNMPIILTDPLGTCPGGFAQNHDPSNQQHDNERAGGPFQPDGDSEEAQANQTPGIHWISTPGPCPGWTDQGGGGGMGVNNFTTLDGEDMGQIPSGLMGSADSNNTYYGFGLGFSPWMQNGPTGAYFNPQSQGCYTPGSGGVKCVDGEVENIISWIIRRTKYSDGSYGPAEIIPVWGNTSFSATFGQGAQIPSITLTPDLGASRPFTPPTPHAPRQAPKAQSMLGFGQSPFNISGCVGGSSNLILVAFATGLSSNYISAGLQGSVGPACIP